MVQPDTVIRWHRQGFRYHWPWKSRQRGRPSIDPEIIQLIRRMCRANPLSSAPRIHGELLKLGIDISETTVAKYMVKRVGPPSQSWCTFLLNHAKDTIALDFFTIPTATLKVLFVLIVLSHDRRRILHFNATEHPSADWTARLLLEACGPDETPRYLVRDRDAIYGDSFHRQARAFRIIEAPTTPRSPWQNLYAERAIGSIRRECLDHVIILPAGHPRRILATYAAYYNRHRIHASLAGVTPDSQAGNPPSPIANLSDYRWRSHWRELYQLPTAA